MGGFKDHEKSRDERLYRDPESFGLKPLKALETSKINTFDELTRAMSLTAFGGRKVGEAVDVLERMYTDKNCLRVLTISGAMTVAKMGMLVVEAMERGLVDVLVTTGALQAHGMIEGLGMAHYKLDRNAAPELKDDAYLARIGFNRVTDTIETEANFAEAGTVVERTLARLVESRRTQGIPTPLSIGGAEVMRALGEELNRMAPDNRSILGTAASKDIPIFVPAWSDSELFLEIEVFNYRHELSEKGHQIDILASRDWREYQDKLAAHEGSIGILTIGGGVPRNWAQQLGPQLDRLQGLFGRWPVKRFAYGVRICPDPAHFGHLSGCTYEEGKSWNKFLPDALTAEVLADATIVWPLLMLATFERLDGRTEPE